MGEMEFLYIGCLASKQPVYSYWCSDLSFDLDDLAVMPMREYLLELRPRGLKVNRYRWYLIVGLIVYISAPKILPRRTQIISE